MPSPTLGLLVAAALAGLGSGCLSYALARAQARRARARRLAQMVGLSDPLRSAPARPWHAGLARVADRTQGVRRVLRGRADEVIRISTIVGLAAALIGLVAGSLAWLVLVGVAAGLVLWLRRHTAAARRLEQQAADAFEMLANGLRAGHSIPQAIGLVARESPQPTAGEFATAERDLALGLSLAEALARLAERTALADYRLVSIVIWIQSEVGGNLPIVLDAVVATLRERFDLRQQVLAVTSQQRLASLVLSLLPVGVLLLFLGVDRAFIEPMFVQPVGRIMLTVAAVLLAGGWFAMRAVSRVEL
jgi:tight adherence protein B